MIDDVLKWSLFLEAANWNAPEVSHEPWQKREISTDPNSPDYVAQKIITVVGGIPWIASVSTNHILKRMLQFAKRYEQMNLSRKTGQGGPEVKGASRSWWRPEGGESLGKILFYQLSSK